MKSVTIGEYVEELARPSLQIQAARAVLAIDELESAGQFKQAEGPVKLLYCPAIHFSHQAPDCVHPISHIHTEETTLRLNAFVLETYFILLMLVRHLSESEDGRGNAFTASCTAETSEITCASRADVQIPMIPFLAFTFPRLPLTLRFRWIPLSRRRRGI